MSAKAHFIHFCIVGCTELHIDHGWVTVTNDTAVYECHTGYRLDGSDTRKCLKNGCSMDQGYQEWSLTAPTCVYLRKYSHT